MIDTKKIRWGLFSKLALTLFDKSFFDFLEKLPTDFFVFNQFLVREAKILESSIQFQ